MDEYGTNRNFEESKRNPEHAEAIQDLLNKNLRQVLRESDDIEDELSVNETQQSVSFQKEGVRASRGNKSMNMMQMYMQQAEDYDYPYQNSNASNYNSNNSKPNSGRHRVNLSTGNKSNCHSHGKESLLYQNES